MDHKGADTMTEEKKKRQPLSLNMGSMNTPPGMGLSAERIRQNLTHGRSKTVTVENKRKNHRPMRYPPQDEKNAKLTEQEQQLRWKAVQDALAQEEVQKREKPVEIKKEIVVPPVKDIPLAEPVSVLEVAPVIETIVIEPEEKTKKVFSSARPVRETKKPELDRKKKFDRPGSSPSTASRGVGRSQNPFDNSPQKKTRKEHGDFDESRPQFGLKKLRSSQGRGRDKKVAGFSREKIIALRPGLTLQEFSSALGQKIQTVTRSMSKLGIKAQMDKALDTDLMELVAQELGYTIKMTYAINREEALWDMAAKTGKARPPIVTIMGHVNHGKTSLLDALRKTDVVSQESGGITQHIGAYQVRLASGKVITFIDTPGHQAFTSMRARGAHLTDIVVLVVAADEGLNEQTIEAIHHCQAAHAPMIVAINKIDKPGAQPDHVRQALLSHNIVVEKLGGDVQDVEVSALKNINLDGLEEAILLQAEILDLKADYEMRPKGIVLETHMKKGHGVVATLLVQEGTLKKGDPFVVGQTWGKVRLMFDDRGKILSHAEPSQPVEVVGLSQVPQAGDRFVVVEDEAHAKDFVGWKQDKITKETLEKSKPLTIEELLRGQQIKEKSFIIKSDTQGGLEGLTHELEKLEHEEIKPKVILKGVGTVNEGDALLAVASNAMILAFNVEILPEARKIIEEKKLKVLRSKVIYQMIDEIRDILSGLLAPVYEEEFLGRANVIQVFEFKKQAFIGGCLIKEGLLRRGAQLRVIRDKKVIFEGTLKNLRHLKDDVKEKTAGHECGVSTEGFTQFKIGDVVECFDKKIVKRSI